MNAVAAGAVVAAGVFASSKSFAAAKAILAGFSTATLTKIFSLLSRACFGLKREPWPIEEWVLQSHEDAVDEDIPILDAHHHLWDARTQDKGWPVGGFMLWLLYKLKPRVFNDMINANPQVKNSFGDRCPVVAPYMGEQLTKDIQGEHGKGHNVVATVYIECGWKTPGVEPCMEPVREADMVTKVNQQFPKLCKGIVAHADLRLGKDVMPALKYYQRNPLVKGIRHSLAWSDDPSIHGGPCEKGTAYDAKFREGFALLAEHGFSYDCWLFHEQVDDLADLARTFPGTTIICDHIAFPLGIGKYDIKETVPRWKASMKLLAANPNVYVKLGGFGMRFSGHGFDERAKPPSSDELTIAWKPYIDFVIETFGVDRCMMESNFPMDKISCSYTVLWNALKKATRNRSFDDRRKMFELNARKVYRL